VKNLRHRAWSQQGGEGQRPSGSPGPLCGPRDHLRPPCARRFQRRAWSCQAARRASRPPVGYELGARLAAYAL